MQLTEDKKKECIQKILLSRVRILNEYPFYGLLLMHMQFGLDETEETAYTTGEKICFSPEFLLGLTDKEIDFVLMHEILHVALKHCQRSKEYNKELFNIACDIVVNSNILKSCDMDKSRITINGSSELMHIAPDGNEGYMYTAEEVYEMLINKIEEEYDIKVEYKTIDSHTYWEITATSKEMDERVITIATSMSSSKNLPLGIEREINELIKPTVDWQLILNNFLSYEVNDYSFTPPDNRYEELIMPAFNDLNESDKIYKKILFVVDTSGSISKKDLTKAVSEIKGALDYKQLEEAYMVTMDSYVYDPIRLNMVKEIQNVGLKGGGGTSFINVFEMLDAISKKIGGLPDFIIFITDGYAEFGDESMARGIPVLWLINNKKVTPKWGMVGRI